MARYKRKKSASKTGGVSTTVGITLVLFMLGTLSLVLMNAKKLSDYVKENIQFQVFLKEDVKEADLTRVQKSFDSKLYVKSTTFVNKEEAASNLQKELGEDFVSFLGYNPLLNSIDINLKADYANPDSITWIESELMANNKVKEVVYSPDLIQKINENIERISLVILAFSALLLLIAIALINNTIRLAIYSKRFLIKTMQLVGAKNSFIRKPFVGQAFRQGVYAGIFATALIMGVIYLVQNEIPEFFELQDAETFIKIFLLVIALGISISWFSTALAVRRYVRLDSDKLY
ncbi:MAG: cell division transport system permease protein [Flavobacteriales bacterium]|jgi:cell division transport system permease protein